MSSIYSETEISNEYSSWVKSNHTHNFRYLYVFMLLLISWNLLYSYWKFELLILNSVLHTQQHVWLNIYTNHNISMNTKILTKRIALFPALSLFFCCKCLTTRTVNFYQWFESLKAFISTKGSTKFFFYFGKSFKKNYWIFSQISFFIWKYNPSS